MKMTSRILKYRIISLFLTTIIIVGCSEEFLKPEPLSFITTEAGLVDAKAMYSTLAYSTIRIRNHYMDGTFAPPMFTETLFSEVMVDGTSDKTFPSRDMNRLVIPDGVLTDASYNRIGHCWDYAYLGIKSASIVITNIDQPKYKSDKEKNEVLGTAYFHRAFWYYLLVHQFGDVPFINEQIAEPKLDFYSTEREVILQKIKQDLEFAINWVPVNVNKGMVSRGACNHLLTKIYLALGEFDNAITSSSAVINGGYSLMTSRFGSDKADASKNVIWDLHRPTNKVLPENKEEIFSVIDRYGLSGNLNAGATFLYIFGTYWGGPTVLTPTGKRGTSDAVGAEIPQVETYGRGVCKGRGTNYSTRFIWDDPNDLRHAPGNWVKMEDLVYNNPTLKTQNDPYYGKHIQFRDSNGKILVGDTIRSWSGGWPHYKFHSPDPYRTQSRGGNTDWYVFRLAETYLLRAEAYYWKDNIPDALKDLNMVRQRAGAAPYTNTADFNIGTILDERARELFYEEPRNCELTRIAFLLAKTGKSYKGKTYNLSNFSESNFWYDRIMEKTEFFNKGVTTLAGDFFTLSPFHVLWPVPQTVINSNSKGVINQNKGYTGYENNVPPLKTIP